MNATTNELAKAIKSLKTQHKTDWLVFNARIEAILAAMSARMGVEWTTQEDITEHVISEDFAAAGFTQAETEALTFVLTEECMGYLVNSAEMIERWFCYCA